MKNIRFVIAGIEMQMASESMSLQMNNPMFVDVGSHSLPLKISRTPHNDAALEGFHPGSLSTSMRFPAQLYLGARPFYGEWITSTRKDQFYEGHFTTGISTFRDAVRNKKLTDLDYTESISGPPSGFFPDELNNAAANTYPTYNYTCFPIRTPDFFDPYEETFNTMMNPWSFMHDNSDYLGFVKNYPQRYAPSFYLCFVISKVFSEFGYAIESNDFYNDNELRTLAVTNINSGYVGMVTEQYDLRFSEALPAIEINEFISGLEKLFNVTFFINDQSNSVVIKKNTAIIKSLPTRTLALVRREIIQENKPDGFNLEYNFEQGDSFSTISSIEGLVIGITVANVEDLSGYLAASYPNQLARVTNHDLYFVSKRDSDGPAGWDWAEYTRDFFKYSESSGELNINSNVNPVLTEADIIEDIYSAGSYQEHAIIPRTNITSINSFGWQKFKSFDSLRLLFYRGLIASGGNVDNPALQECNYPLASPDVYRAYSVAANTFGRTKIPSANQTLRWGGTYGLYETNWKDYLYWLLKIKRSAIDYYDISQEEFLRLNPWEKYQAGGQSVLFRTINLEIDFANDSLQVGECEVYLS